MLRKPTTLSPTLQSESTQIISNVGTTNMATNPTPIAKDKTTVGHEPDDTTLDRLAWIAIGFTTVFIALAKSIAISIESHAWVQPILAGLYGYVLSDLISGVYHWGIDNYGDATTPILGAQIEAFQWHHEQPWDITRYNLASNLYKLSKFTTLTFLPIILISNDPILLAFVGSLSTCLVFSHQIHVWAHSTKSELPLIVVALQHLGVILSRSQHTAHHQFPHYNNYCIISGIWNKILDDNQVFEAFEKVIFSWFGVKPRSWKEP